VIGLRIAVTGALGHIGSQLIRDLPGLLPDTELLLIDNLATQRYCSLFDLPSSSRYRFVEADILQADLTDLLAGQDVVVHLAAITDATSSFDQPEEVEEVNFVGAQRVARICGEMGAAFVFPSTTSVYGPQGDAVAEDCPDSDLNPQSPYAESKLRAEDCVRGMASAGLRAVIFRFGTIFGISPGMRFHTAINKFCWQAAHGLPLTVWRTALDQRRPYLDLSDAVRAVGHAIESEMFDGKTFNVLTLNASVRQLVDTIKTFVPSVSVEYVDTEIMNQLSYNVSSEQFERFGFSVEGDLTKSIRLTLERLGTTRDRSPEMMSDKQKR
jgi:UDP-glucose 4-epimerase